jgi:anti-sigma-K factor RskA
VVSAGHGHGDGPAAAELAADVVGRALHALEPDEESRVAEHLRECAVCRALLSETHETMAALAHALPSQEPPASLRTRILEAAAAEPDRPAPQEREETRPPTRELPVAPAPVPDDDVAGPRTVPTPAAPRRRTAAVLVLAAVIAGIVVFAARGAIAPGPGDPRAVVAQQAEQVVASAEARDPSVRSASLVQPGNGTVAAVVLDDASGPRVVPLAMPAIGTGRTFVLWRVAGNAVVPVGAMDPTGSFTPMSAAPGTTAAPAPTRLAYALSVEPAGSVPTRPSAVVASGPLV